MRELTEAAIHSNWAALAEVRQRAHVRMGPQAVTDALVVAAAFNGITRVADATGTPLDPSTHEVTASMRQETGIEQFDYTQKTGRYGKPNDVALRG